MTELHQLLESGPVITETPEPAKGSAYNGWMSDALAHADKKASPLSRALTTIMSWDVAGPQPTYTATVIVENSVTMYFTPGPDETPYEALQREIDRRVGSGVVIRHSDPRAL
jgi:hypothetical protein